MLLRSILHHSLLIGILTFSQIHQGSAVMFHALGEHDDHVTARARIELSLQKKAAGIPPPLYIAPFNEQGHLLDFPPELLFKVGSFLNPADLRSLSQVSQGYRRAFLDPLLIRHITESLGLNADHKEDIPPARMLYNAYIAWYAQQFRDLNDVAVVLRQAKAFEVGTFITWLRVFFPNGASKNDIKKALALFQATHPKTRDAEKIEIKKLITQEQCAFRVSDILKVMAGVPSDNRLALLHGPKYSFLMKRVKMT